MSILKWLETDFKRKKDFQHLSIYENAPLPIYTTYRLILHPCSFLSAVVGKSLLPSSIPFDFQASNHVYNDVLIIYVMFLCLGVDVVSFKWIDVCIIVCIASKLTCKAGYLSIRWFYACLMLVMAWNQVFIEFEGCCWAWVKTPPPVMVFSDGWWWVCDGRVVVQPIWSIWRVNCLLILIACKV